MVNIQITGEKEELDKVFNFMEKKFEIINTINIKDTFIEINAELKVPSNKDLIDKFKGRKFKFEESEEYKRFERTLKELADNARAILRYYEWRSKIILKNLNLKILVNTRVFIFMLKQGRTFLIL